jgi:hypothetical protein
MPLAVRAGRVSYIMDWLTYSYSNLDYNAFFQTILIIYIGKLGDRDIIALSKGREVVLEG